MPQSPKNESVQDSLTDLANYAVMAGMLLDKEWVKDKSTTLSNFKNRMKQMTDLFASKLNDYGTLDILEVGAEGVLSRMVDKYHRVKNLMEMETEPLLVHQSSIGEIHAPKKEGDVGYDLVVLNDVEIRPRSNTTVDVATGVKVKIPHGYWGMVVNRSSTPRKRGLIVMNGVIDTGYTGEIFACVWNYTDEPVLIKAGEKLAQLVIFKSYVHPITPVSALPETQRGETGFGSTGI